MVVQVARRRRRTKRRKIDFSRIDFTSVDDVAIRSQKDVQPKGDSGASPKADCQQWEHLTHQLLHRQTFGTRIPRRPFCTRSTRIAAEYQHTIRFRDLGTPPTAAVLGCNATGTAIAALYKSDSEVSSSDAEVSFALCIYSFPPPAFLICTIPLEDTYSPYHSINGNDTGEWDSTLTPAPCRVPFRMWWSADGQFGACLYRTGADGLATTCVWRITGGRDTSCCFWTLRNLAIPSVSQCDTSTPSKWENMLWNVEVVPMLLGSSSCCSSTSRLDLQICSAYLFCVDEGDGYSVTWFGNSCEERRVFSVEKLWKCNPAGVGVKVVRADEQARIFVPTTWSDAGWEQQGNDVWSIPLSGFVSTSVLLHSILQLTPNLLEPSFEPGSPRLPNYTHSIVSTKSSGRVLELCLVFSVGPVGRGCVAVFVDVDLCTQDWCVHHWMRLREIDTPVASASCKLAQQRLRRIKQGGTKKDVMLYPDCVTLDNLAVRLQRPVWVLSARDAPIRIVYS